MKRTMRNLLPFSMLVIASVIIFASCGKVKDSLDTQCDNLEEKFLTATTNLGTNPTKASCEEYYDALRELVDKCSAYKFYNSTWETMLDEEDCSDWPE